MRKTKSPSPGGTRGRSNERDREPYPVAASAVKGKVCRACLYYHEGMARKRPRPVCSFTGERIADGWGCEFFHCMAQGGSA